MTPETGILADGYWSRTNHMVSALGLTPRLLVGWRVSDAFSPRELKVDRLLGFEKATRYQSLFIAKIPLYWDVTVST